MFASVHRRFAVASVVLLAACGGSTTSPSQASIIFTATPNPVPSSGVSASCVGFLTKNWFWTWNIRNAGSAPFTVASFQNTLVVPGLAPIVTQGTANDFLALYGSTNIAPNSAVQATVCIGLVNPPSANITTTSILTGQSGETFTTPTVQLLP